MRKIQVNEFSKNGVWQVYRIKDQIDPDPEYQRQGGVWSRSQQQLLMDTIINSFDIPKIYLHEVINGKIGSKYAIVDGKQRLQAIWSFIEGDYGLDDEFVYFSDPTILLAGMKYPEIARKYPDIKTDFDSFALSILVVRTDDMEMIEEMFSRLNEAMTLTSAEKRNALGGPLPKIIRKLAQEPLFVDNLPFKNTRYRHYDLAVKFLMLADRDAVVDTKRMHLDKYVLDWREKEKEGRAQILETEVPESDLAREVCEVMSSVFLPQDRLLKNVANITVYFHLFRIARQEGWISEVTRDRLEDFEQARRENRETASRDFQEAQYDFIEYDKYNQYPNDGFAIKIRLRILLHHAFKRDVDVASL